MTKEDLKKSIKENDKDRIMKNLNEVWREEKLWEDCFEIILELFYSTEDKEMINQIDWTIYFILEKNGFDKVEKIIKHEKYTYEKIKMFSHTYNAIFQNNKFSSELYKYFILKDAKKHLKELMNLVRLKIDINSINLSFDEKIVIFYKTMGIVNSDVKNNMNICFDILLDDKLLQKDKSMLLTFSCWFGWNWMLTSEEFIKQCKPMTDSQKQLLEYLKLYIEGVKEENTIEKLSKDFEIDTKIIRAKQRIDRERNEEINKNVEDESVLGKLFPRTHILKGLKVSNITSKGKEVYISKSIPMQEIGFGKYEWPLDYIITPIDFEDTLEYFLAGGKYEADN